MGLATALPFIYAGLRYRRRPLLIFGAGYLVAAGACVALLSSSKSDTGWPSTTGAVIALALVVGGTAHLLALRRIRLEPAEGGNRDWSEIRPPADDPDRRALHEAKERMARRARARDLVQRDPALADELRIGRPDLGRTFDDGGLIDVNRASRGALMETMGCPEEVVDRIVGTRSRYGGFLSLEHMCFAIDADPEDFRESSALLLFRT
jgi:hypothetical protein